MIELTYSTGEVYRAPDLRTARARIEHDVARDRPVPVKLVGILASGARVALAWQSDPYTGLVCLSSLVCISSERIEPSGVRELLGNCPEPPPSLPPPAPRLKVYVNGVIPALARDVAAHLEAHGHRVVSRWHSSGTAGDTDDACDLFRCDMVVTLHCGGTLGLDPLVLMRFAFVVGHGSKPQRHCGVVDPFWRDYGLRVNQPATLEAALALVEDVAQGLAGRS